MRRVRFGGEQPHYHTHKAPLTNARRTFNQVNYIHLRSCYYYYHYFYTGCDTIARYITVEEKKEKKKRKEINPRVFLPYVP